MMTKPIKSASDGGSRRAKRRCQLTNSRACSKRQSSTPTSARTPARASARVSRRSTSESAHPGRWPSWSRPRSALTRPTRSPALSCPLAADASRCPSRLLDQAKIQLSFRRAAVSYMYEDIVKSKFQRLLTFSPSLRTAQVDLPDNRVPLPEFPGRPLRCTSARLGPRAARRSGRRRRWRALWAS